MHEAQPAHTTIRERDAARYIDFSDTWMRQARMRGTGPAYIRIGRTIRYRLSDLDAFLARHRVETRDSRTRREAETARA